MKPISRITSAPDRELRRTAEPARERRFAGGLDLGTLTDEERAAGYIGALAGRIPLETDSVLLRDRSINHGRPFIERIARDAFAESIDGGEDILGMAGHTDATLAAFARSGANLVLTRDTEAINYRALLPDTQTGRDLLALAEKKIIRGTSFEFERGGEDRWEKRGDVDVRTVTKGRLVTVNPVPWPAYDDSSLTAQRGADGDSEERNCYYGPSGYYSWNDPTITCDAAYAGAALSRSVHELTDSLEYLRAAPAGALVESARARVAASASAAAELIAWLAANGATVNPDLAARAAASLAEARAAAPAPAEPTFTLTGARAARFGLR